jgi:hypothetical protein
MNFIHVHQEWKKDNKEQEKKRTVNYEKTNETIVLLNWFNSDQI